MFAHAATIVISVTCIDRGEIEVLKILGLEMVVAGKEISKYNVIKIIDTDYSNL